MWASVQTVRGCPKNAPSVQCGGPTATRRAGSGRCSKKSRLRAEVPFRRVAATLLPVTLTDLDVAARRTDRSRLDELTGTRPKVCVDGRALANADDWCFHQITMEAAEDPEYLDAMRRANQRGLVGVEAVTPEGLKDIYKTQCERRAARQRLQTFRRSRGAGAGSFIFGLASDRPENST